MKSFKDWKTASKILTAVLILNVLILGVGLYGLRNASELNDMIDQMYEKELVGTSTIMDANINMLYGQRALLRSLIEEDIDKSVAQAQDMVEYNNKTLNVLAQAEPLFVSDEGKRLFSELNGIISKWKASGATLQKLLDNPDLATETIRKSPERERFATDTNLLDDKLTDLVELKNKIAKQANDDSTVQYDSMVLLTWISVGAAVLVGLLLGMFVSRAISAPLLKIVDAAQEVSAGNLDADLNIVRKDEVGVLAESLRVMVGSLKQKISEANAMSEAAKEEAENARKAMAAAEVAQGEAQQKSEAMTEIAQQLQVVAEAVASA